ncbi:hypothetical protein [Kribbella monticola]|uniref:hypothetical protein n=1 Tax=Kribbella monticola TaxID=2185285 RepID=UPI0013006B65|nr:hypothetical protein [Kribbella monticola]
MLDRLVEHEVASPAAVASSNSRSIAWPARRHSAGPSCLVARMVSWRERSKAADGRAASIGVAALSRTGATGRSGRGPSALVGSTSALVGSTGGFEHRLSP